MIEVILFVCGLLLGYNMAKHKIGEVRHTIKLDAREAIKQLKEAEKAVKDLEKELW